MISIKRYKKGDLVWKINCQNGGTFNPAIFVRNVRGDKALVDIVDGSGELNRESVPVKNLVISTCEVSEIKIKNKELKKSCNEASLLVKNKAQTSCRVRLDKNAVSKFQSESNELANKEETNQARKGRKRPRNSSPIKEKPVEEKEEKADDPKQVLKTIDESSKDFHSNLDSDDEDSEKNNNKENENENENEDKENTGTTKKSSTQWKPVLGSGGPRKALKEMVPYVEKEELPDCDYEKIRLKNIAEQKAMFLEQLKNSATALSKSMKPKPRSYTPNSMSTFRRKEVVRKIYSTRSSRSNSISPNDSPKKISEVDDYSSDEEFIEYIGPKKRKSMPHMWAFNPNDRIAKPEDVTQRMLDNVADYVSQKVYSQNGTTCHQCRQKTIDQKTICRSGHCAGVRGMFCGICLRNRYGQDVRKALKDPDWWCPPCMDYCNCSICRNRIGKGATGIMTQLAISRGFASVHHYLDSLVKKVNK